MVEVLAGIFVIYFGFKIVVGILGWVSEWSILDYITVWEVPEQKPKPVVEGDREHVLVTRARNKTREEWEG